jgi:hypothetical protein
MEQQRRYHRQRGRRDNVHNPVIPHHLRRKGRAKAMIARSGLKESAMASRILYVEGVTS